MIPCKNTCPHYAEGCHKDCAKWKQFLAREQQQRRKKEAYLKMQNELNRILIRQYRQLTASRRYYY